MTTYILHGGFTRYHNKLNDSYYQEIVKDVPDGGNILTIYFARLAEEVPERFAEEKIRILTQASDKNITVSLASENNFTQQVQQANVIVIAGGDTQKLMKTLQQFPGFGEALRGKTVAGSSAGAYVLSKYYHSASADQTYEGLGLVPVRIICHFESDKFETRGSPVEKMEKYPDDLELVVLRDCEWRVFNI